MWLRDMVMVVNRTDKENAMIVRELLKKYSEKNGSKLFEKEKAIQFVIEEVNIPEQFVKICIRELKENGDMRKPKSGYLSFVK